MPSAKLSAKAVKRGVSRAQWLETALEVFEREGIAAVKIERLAAHLKIARSGFYWHFKNRRDLLDQMLAHWVHEYTGVVANNPELDKAPPEERLLQVMRMIAEYGLTRFEVPMRAWAGHDPKARETTDQVYAMRLDYLRGIFRELGFEGDELEMRARLFVCYHTWEQATFGAESKGKAARFRRLRHELLTRR